MRLLCNDRRCIRTRIDHAEGTIVAAACKDPTPVGSPPRALDHLALVQCRPRAQGLWCQALVQQGSERNAPVLAGRQDSRRRIGMQREYASCGPRLLT